METKFEEKVLSFCSTAISLYGFSPIKERMIRTTGMTEYLFRLKHPIDSLIKEEILSQWKKEKFVNFDHMVKKITFEGEDSVILFISNSKGYESYYPNESEITDWFTQILKAVFSDYIALYEKERKLTHIKTSYQIPNESLLGVNDISISFKERAIVTLIFDEEYLFNNLKYNERYIFRILYEEGKVTLLFKKSLDVETLNETVLRETLLSLLAQISEQKDEK